MTTEEMFLQLMEGQKETNKRLDNIENDITDMKKDITQLKTDVADMKEDITQLNTDVADMKEDITQLKTDVADMKEDITELKRESKITRVNVNHNGEVLEQMVKDLAPLNMLNVKY